MEIVHGSINIREIDGKITTTRSGIEFGIKCYVCEVGTDVGIARLTRQVCMMKYSRNGWPRGV